MTAAVGFCFAQKLTFAVEQTDFHAFQCTAFRQRLSKYIQLIKIAVHGNADITQGKECGRHGVAVTPGLLHDRQIHTLFL